MKSEMSKEEPAVFGGSPDAVEPQWTGVDAAKAIERNIPEFVKEGSEGVLTLQPKNGISLTITFPVEVWLELSQLALRRDL